MEAWVPEPILLCLSAETLVCLSLSDLVHPLPSLPSLPGSWGVERGANNKGKTRFLYG